VGLGESSGSHENDVKNDSLFQVIKAVEAAEATIKQQVEENNLLKAELQRRYLELAKYVSRFIFHFPGQRTEIYISFRP
jgi:hypothetical protein